MPGEIHRTDKNVTYTITHPDWVCEWIVWFDKTRPVERSCILKDDIDPFNPSDNDLIVKLIPGMFIEVESVIRGWIQAGDVYAQLLLLAENKPFFISYAESIMGLRITT